MTRWPARRFSALATALLLQLCGCKGPERSNPFDQARCDPACGAQKVCFDGTCEDDPCPEEMVHVSRPHKLDGTFWSNSEDTGPFCIDRWEASGQLSSSKLDVTSQPGVTPLIEVSIGAAFAACKAAGKQLCTVDQWLMACFGPHGQGTGMGKDKDDGEVFHGPQYKHCNVGGTLEKTGGTTTCEGGYNGIFDMVGNASEWVLSCSKNSTSCTVHVGDFVGASHNSGSQYQDQETSGCLSESSSLNNPQPSKGLLKTTGFRCCLPCDSSSRTSCQAATKPTWLDHSRENLDPLPAPLRMWGNSRSDIWAVAVDQKSPTALKVLHYDGLIWSADAQTLPCPSSCQAAIWGTSTEMWIVVGESIYRRSGTTWAKVQSLPPACPGSGGSALQLGGIWGTSASDIWAVGRLDSCGVAYHYDGTTWEKRSPLNDPPLDSVWTASSTGVWAVGEATVHHYDGTSWTTRAAGLPSNTNWRTREVWGTSTSDVWLIVEPNSGSGLGALYRYDFSKTIWIESSLVQNQQAAALGGTSASDVWAVTSTTIQHYDGSGWKTELTIDQNQPFIPRAIWAAAEDDVWFGTVRYY